MPQQIRICATCRRKTARNYKQKLFSGRDKKVLVNVFFSIFSLKLNAKSCQIDTGNLKGGGIELSIHFELSI